MLDRSFWRDRKVFLTGHTGFKGSWLSLWLDTLGAQVTGYALGPPTSPNLFEQADVVSGMRSVIADIRDFERLKAELAVCQPEVVFHLAAQSVVLRGYDDPMETYSVNVMGTVHILEAVRQLGLRCVVVNVTSDKCYENRERIWGYRENEPMGGHDPYSNSKGCAELVTSAYRDSFFPPAQSESHGVALASARAGNAIGGGDWTSNQLIPDLMKAFMSKSPCLIRRAAAVRPWQFVMEPLHGYLLLAEHLTRDALSFACGWNFGPAEDDAQPVSRVADLLAQAWGADATWCRDPMLRPPEAGLLRLDTSMARTLLAWRPHVPLPLALDWIVDWYRGFACGANLRALTRAQIKRYEARIEAG
jgi:CDP-glucose 4,6-dehydratase